MNRAKRVLCFALAGLFILAAPTFTSGNTTEETQTEYEEYTDKEFAEFLEWETNDNYERDLRNGVFKE